MSTPPPEDKSVPPPSVALCEEMWDNNPAGMAVVDRSGVIVRANAAFADMLGWGCHELLGLPLIRVQPASKVMLMQALHKSIIEGQDPSVWSGEETLFVNRRGRPLATYTRNQRILLDNEEPARLVVAIDLSDVARVDQDMESLNRVRSYTALASAVSNEMNNLLSIMLGYTALLREGTSDAHRQQVVAEGVEGAVQRASILIKQSLYMMRRPDPVRQQTNLGSFLESRLQVLRAEISHRPIELELAMTPELQEVPLDVMQLGDALGEVIRRLHVFDPDTTRALRVRTRWQAGSEVHTRFGQSTARAYAVIELTNPPRPRTSSRPPVPPEEHPEEPGRHDLGMTMVERVIEAHQGFCVHTAERGTESVFTIWLPMSGEVEEEPVPTGFTTPPIPRDEGSRPGRILLIDDEESLLETMAAALRNRDYEVVTALDGETALLEYRQHADSLALVISDLVLPGMSGWEVFSHIREADPDLPVLIMSGHLEPKLESAVNRSGAAGFMQKPFGISLFLRRVQAVINGPGG